MKYYLQPNYIKSKNFQSPVDPMKHRVITVAPLGDGALLTRCQEPASDVCKDFLHFLFCYLICFYFENLVALVSGLGPSLRASTI
jgi:hypothetical protein